MVISIGGRKSKRDVSDDGVGEVLKVAYPSERCIREICE